MSLIPIEHARRLASAAEAEAFFRALGKKVVSARGFHTEDAGRAARLVEAIVPAKEHTISFTRGVVDKAPLDALAVARFEYLDLRTKTAELRVWPGLRTWVHGAGVNLETDAIPLALDTFHRIAGKEEIERGFINGVAEATKPLLATFLARIGARVDAVLELPVASARSLTELYSGEALDWQADGVLVDFPSGRVHGFLVSPNVGADAREQWLARIDAALRRARVA